MAILAAAMLLAASTQSLEPPEEVVTLAEQAGIDATDLFGALLSQPGVDAKEYLIFEGLLKRPVPVVTDWRVACIEAKESHGQNVWNRQGSGAGGVMQYFPGTFARGAREMGHPEWSLWVPEQARAVAAHDLAMGRRSQWTVAGCR